MEPVDKEWVRAVSSEVMARLNAYTRNPFTIDSATGRPRFDGSVPSSRNPEVFYHVVVPADPTAHATCTCPAYVQYYRGKDCSHIRAVKEAMNA